jgi:hypothetical protein
VLVQDGLGDAGGLGHVLHRGAVEPMGSKNVGGDIE